MPSHPSPGKKGPSYVALPSFFLDKHGRPHTYTTVAQHAGSKSAPLLFGQPLRPVKLTPSRRAARADRQEILPGEQLTSMMRELLQNFQRTWDLLPHRIVFYRDGVAHSQFEEVHLTEVRALKDALPNDWPARLTFLVAQKRNSTRFFRADGNGASLAASCFSTTLSIFTSLNNPFASSSAFCTFDRVHTIQCRGSRSNPSRRLLISNSSAISCK